MRSTSLNAVYAAGQTILIVLYAVVFFLDRTPPVWSGQAWRALGLVVCVAGLALMASAFIALRSVIQIAPQPREGGHLITAGPYRYLRHPIYTGILIIVAGLFLRKATPVIALATILVFVFVVVKSAYEERLLEQKYPAYREYRLRTWGVIPFLT